MQNPLESLRPSTIDNLAKIEVSGGAIKTNSDKVLIQRGLLDPETRQPTTTGKAVLAMHGLTPDARQCLIRLIRNGGAERKLSILSFMTWTEISNYTDALLVLAERGAVTLRGGFVYLTLKDAVVEEMERLYPVAMQSKR